METAASSLSPRLSVATSASKEQPLATMDALPPRFKNASSALKRPSRRRAVGGAIADDLRIQDAQKPGFVHISQRPPTSPQNRVPGLASRKALLKKRQRLDDILPSLIGSSELGSASAGLSMNNSPGPKTVHTYSRKTTGAHRATIAENGLCSVSAESSSSKADTTNNLRDAVDDCGVHTNGTEDKDPRYRSEQQQPPRRRVHLRKRKPIAHVDEVPNTQKVVAVGKLTKIHGKRKRRAPVGELALVRSAAEGAISSSQVNVLSRIDPSSEVLEDLIDILPKTTHTAFSNKELLPSKTPSASSSGQKSLSVIRKTIILPKDSSHVLYLEGRRYKQLPATPRGSNWPVRRLGSGFEGLENIVPPKEPRRRPRRCRTRNGTPTETSSLDFAEVRREAEARRVHRPPQPANKRSKDFTSAMSSDTRLSGSESTGRGQSNGIEEGSTDVQPHEESRYTTVQTHAKNPIHLPAMRQQSEKTTIQIRPIIALHQNLRSCGNNEDLPTGRIVDQPRHQACRVRRRVTFEDEIWRQPPKRSSPLPQTSTSNNTREIDADDEEVPLHLPTQPRESDESDAFDNKATDQKEGAIRQRSEIPETPKSSEQAASYRTAKGPLRSILKRSSYDPSQIWRMDSAEEEEDESMPGEMKRHQSIPESSLNTTKYFSQAAQQLNSPATKPDMIMPPPAQASPIHLRTPAVQDSEEGQGEPAIPMNSRITVTPSPSRRRSASPSDGRPNQHLASVTGQTVGDSQEAQEEPVVPMTSRITVAPSPSRRRAAPMSGGGPNHDLGSLARRVGRELGTAPERKRRGSGIPFVRPFKGT